MHDNFNKLAVKISQDLWFEIYAKHEYNESPYKYFVEGGLKYPTRDLKAKLNISEPMVDAKEYNGEVYLQWDVDKRATTDFNIARGNDATVGYVFTSNTYIPGIQPIKLKGNLELFDQKSAANIEWNYGQQNYTAVVEYFPDKNSTEQQKIQGELNMNAVKYKGSVIMKNKENEKSLFVDLNSDRHIFLLLEAKNGFNDIKLDFMWDKDVDPTKRIMLETNLDHQNLLAHAVVFEYEAKVNGSYTSSSVDATIEWGSRKAEIEAKLLFMINNIDILFGLKTSNPTFSNIRTHVKFHVDTDEYGSRVLDSVVSLLPNILN